MLLAGSHHHEALAGQSRAPTYDGQHFRDTRSHGYQLGELNPPELTAVPLAVYLFYLWFVYAHDQERPTYGERHASQKSY
jgi:hypothetical protein